MKAITLILIVIFLSINLYAQSENGFNINDLEYNINLIKFYVDKIEYDNALEYIDKILEEAIEKDSLYYFKAYIYKEKEDWLQASDFFAKAILNTSEESLINDWLINFEEAISQVYPLPAFDLVSVAVTNAQNTQKHTGFLNVLARLYENNQLYSEANDVYRTILLEIDGSESCNLKMKIVTNNIFQKDYEEALNILKPLIVLDDSLYIEKLLFLDYIANISLQDYEDAKISLLRLYLEFPQHSNRKEILAGLVDIYEHQEQYLLSWYMLNKLFSISNDAQKFKLQNDLDRIKRKICEDPTTEDQFKNFLPIFEIEKNIFKAESNK